MVSNILSFSMRLTSTEVKAPWVQDNLETIEGLLGCDWSSLATEYPSGIPQVISEAIDTSIFQKGLRLCDTEIKIPESKAAVPLWRIAIPDQIDKDLRNRQQKGIRRAVAAGYKTDRIEVSPSSFWKVVQAILALIQDLSCLKLNSEHQPSFAPSGGNMYDLIRVNSEQPYGSSGRRMWTRFVKTFFCKGHKFGPIEQFVAAVHLDTLQFTDLSKGFWQRPKASAGLILLAIINPDRTSKSFKKFTSTVEDELFEYIGEDPSTPEEIDPVTEIVLRDYFSSTCFDTIRLKKISEEEEYENTLRWIECFCPSRNLPKPDDVSVADVYEEYLGYLTTRTHIGERVTETQVEEFVNGPDGQFTEDFLSRVIAGQILNKGLKHAHGVGSVLNGTSTPIEKISTSATLQFTRKHWGHYGEIAVVVKEFLMEPISKVFPFLCEDVDGNYVCDDYGTKLCYSVHKDLSVWQIAYLIDPCCHERDKLFLPNPNVYGSIYGLDQRFGSLIFLYGAYTCRPWIESMDKFVEGGGKINTEQDVDRLVSAGILKIPAMRTVPVLEPGGKVRWVSASSGALTYFQIAFAENLRDLYTNVDGARVGLASDHHLFRFEQSFASHSLDKILRPETREFFTPLKVREILENEFNGEKSTEFKVRIFLEIARSTAQSFSIQLPSSIVSLLPLGRELQSALFKEMQKIETFDHDVMRIRGATTYQEWEESILNSPLKDDVITCQTSDMVKATDTFRHDIHHRNLSSVLRNLGYDVDVPPPL